MAVLPSPVSPAPFFSAPQGPLTHAPDLEEGGIAKASVANRCSHQSWPGRLKESDWSSVSHWPSRLTRESQCLGKGTEKGSLLPSPTLQSWALSQGANGPAGVQLLAFLSALCIRQLAFSFPSLSFKTICTLANKSRKLEGLWFQILHSGIELACWRMSCKGNLKTNQSKRKTRNMPLLISFCLLFKVPFVPFSVNAAPKAWPYTEGCRTREEGD